MNRPPKPQIRAAFDRAAASYDAAAVLQRRVCERLLDGLPADPQPSRILDAGCGTGYGTRLLRGRWPEARIDAIDFAPAMLAVARANDTRADGHAAADIEALPFADGVFDAYWSSLSIQWCEPRTVFGEAARLLRPGARLAVSSLGPGTFAELRDAFAGLDRYRHTLAFAEAEALTAAMDGAGLRRIELRRESVRLYYPDLKALLGAVKAIGANGIGGGRRSGMMGKATWRALEAAYERRRTAAGLPATYEVFLCTAER